MQPGKAEFTARGIQCSGGEPAAQRFQIRQTMPQQTRNERRILFKLLPLHGGGGT